MGHFSDNSSHFASGDFALPATPLASSVPHRLASKSLSKGATSPGDGRVRGEIPTVYVVDDDPDVRESLSLMIHDMGLNVEAFPSAEAFLDGYLQRV